MSETGPFNPQDMSLQPPALTPDYRSSRLRAPRHKLLSLEQGPGELTGPTFGHDENNIKGLDGENKTQQKGHNDHRPHQWQRNMDEA